MDDWQKWVLAGSLGERADGRWSAFECALVLPRQNGKNAILEAVELAGVVLFGDDLIVHTAHRADTTLEHFRRMELYAEEFDEFGKLVKHVSHKNGDEAIELKGDRRIKFVSRARNPGRGFSGSKVVFDEAGYGLTAAVIGAVIPTMATRQLAQVWYTSSAPKSDSLVLHSVVKRGRGADVDNGKLFYAEWGNDPDTDPRDRDAWYRANPGLGIRITEEYVESERQLMLGVPEEFARERLGVPEPPASELNDGPIPLDRWNALVDADSLPVDVSLRLALDVPPERTSADFVIAGKREDNLAHVSIRLHVPPKNMRSLVETAKTLADGHGTPLILPPNSPAKAWKAELVAAGVELDELSPAEYAEGCGALMAKVAEGSIRHRGTPEMNSAVAGLASRASGDVETFSRRSSSANIAPIVGAACALVRVPETPRAEDLTPMFAVT